MIKFVKKIIKKKLLISSNKNALVEKERQQYIENGCIPWSKGYHAFKEEFITKSINNQELLKEIKSKAPLNNYGFRLDERVIEYPWIFSKLNTKNATILDAGSTFNFDFIVNHPNLKNKDLTIFTFAPESNNFCNKRISYVYGDLRALPFKDEWFDTIVSQSTIEHIDMDNSIYGYDLNHNEDIHRKSYEFLIAVDEMLRVLKSKGDLLLTFPFGKFENHGFFQQLDEEMLNRISDLFKNKGSFELVFFKYEMQGWRFAEKDELINIVSYNPHTGKGKQDDNAAHCRSIACVHFIKN